MRTVRFAVALAAVLATGACGAVPPPRGAPPAAPEQSRLYPVPSPAGPLVASRQTPEQANRTLASLRKVDDLPLYEMTYEGDYDAMVGVAATPTQSPFGCSLFVASGDPQRPLFARNFDWDPNPALLLYTRRPDAYASVSIVDIAYLGVAKDPTGDHKLLNAPLLPFDGMNERGLVVGLAADDRGQATADPGKPSVGGVRVLRLILDQAATVDEALAIIGRYNLNFDGGPALHYLLADAHGKSAVVEFIGGRMVVLPGGRPGQTLTNIQLAGADEATRQRDNRYATASSALTGKAGAMDWRSAMGVLRDVAQSHTRWSVTYEMTTGAVHVVTAKRWETVHEFKLAMRHG